MRLKVARALVFSLLLVALLLSLPRTSFGEVCDEDIDSMTFPDGGCTSGWAYSDCWVCIGQETGTVYWNPDWCDSGCLIVT